MLQQIVCFCIFGIFQLIRADTRVTAIICKDVVLPCTFQPAILSEIVLHWMYKKPEKSIVVHSFYRGTNQLKNQAVHYRGRTKLFNNEIIKGNASLHLTEINVDDEGVYHCYVSTSGGKMERNIFLQVAGDSKNLTLYPPNMLDAVTNITCAVNGAYPKPLIKWQDENGTDLTGDARLKTSESIDQKRLYNIKSILKIDRKSKATYKCNITNERLQKSWTASWKMQGILKENETHTVAIACDYSSNRDQNLTIMWKFRNSSISPSALICKSVSQYGDKNSGCKNIQTKIQNDQNSSSLILHHVSKEDAGEYTCEIITEDTLQIFTYVLQVDSRPPEKSPKRTHCGIIPAMLLPVIFLIICVMINKIQNKCQTFHK